MAFLNLFLAFFITLPKNKFLLKRLFCTVILCFGILIMVVLVLRKNSFYSTNKHLIVNQLWFFNKSDKPSTEVKLTSTVNKSNDFKKNINGEHIQNAAGSAQFFINKLDSLTNKKKSKHFSPYQPRLSKMLSYSDVNKSDKQKIRKKPSSSVSNNSDNNTTISQIKEVLPWHTRPDKFDHLNENFIYSNLNAFQVNKIETVGLIIIVSSAPSRVDRRLAIRQTWFKQCKSTLKLSVKCVFLTDWKPSSYGVDLQSESIKYGDIYFQNLTGGFDFGKRFLFHMVWAMQNFKFDYFLRLDDDYFLCLERFLNEIPMPPNKLYHWGWIHCIKDLVRPDESIILLSRDLIEIFLGQDPETMLCHKWADQMIGIWINTMSLPNFHYRHDIRLYHNPPASFVEKFKNEKNICSTYIGVHGSYPNQMKTFWKNRGISNFNNKKTLNDHSVYCFYNQYMNWKLFLNEFHAEPTLCINDAHWDGTFEATYYYGRQGE
ncbi:uncharacterized protein LOC100197483 isoform X1 [Hydra vulgaris]|uniref:uncharacterized protein LOC100197483 isoform X1 n=2 Tax=Hydra vulgaris TaxID=6087 RepID=UPI001F5E5427|nr:uncharacterized protein LOC100197483 isoform X1 [Hydra vulgaris]XP_047133130.1 uncharacterized protein LOC100197483 isoform X1 [Hydra vulgaris]XP_047133131.1 uncharacterized protein LOC100197483 isoform X1 [Hydra vulgaris]XP_047133132.1 uncharacterized protein LOC100197483 isoform X1 [Hydra vulgaris]